MEGLIDQQLEAATPVKATTSGTGPLPVRRRDASGFATAFRLTSAARSACNSAASARAAAATTWEGGRGRGVRQGRSCVELLLFWANQSHKSLALCAGHFRLGQSPDPLALAHRGVGLPLDAPPTKKDQFFCGRIKEKRNPHL